MLTKIINITLGILSAVCPLAACDDARTSDGEQTKHPSSQLHNDELEEADVSDHPATGHKLLFHEEK